MDKYGRDFIYWFYSLILIFYDFNSNHNVNHSYDKLWENLLHKICSAYMTKPFIVIKIQSGAIFLKLNSIQILWKLFSKLKFTLTANIIYAFKFPTLDVINVHLLSHRHTVSSILSKWVTLIVTSTTSDLSFSPLTQKMCTQTAGLTPFLMEAKKS